MKTDAFALIAIAACLTFSTGASAITSAESTEATDLDMGFASPLILEYKLKSHSKAIGIRYGQLAAAAKKCNLGGRHFEEADLADMLENYSPDSSASALLNAYQEGLRIDPPECSNIEPYVERLSAQASRHAQEISKLNRHIQAMLAEAQRRHDEKMKAQ